MKLRSLRNIVLNEDINDPTVDPNANAQPQQQFQNPIQMPPSQEQQSAADSFEPLIKSAADIPHSKEKADTMLIAAKIREIEAKTKETLAKAEQQSAEDPNAMGSMDPNMMGGGIDPNTGMPMQPGGQIDPMTGMPLDPNAQQQDDPLKGLGDASAPQDPNSMLGMGGGIDPMTGMPTGDPNEPSKTFTAVGRAFKLKKIYEILDNISRLLHISSDPKFQDLSSEVETAFELFRLVVNNLKIYKEKVDEIIILYYSLLKDVCIKIEDIYKERKLKCSLTEQKLLKNSKKLINESLED